LTRLDDLKARWDREPSSRAFMALSEEYRRLGRLAEAEKACREGLQRHPHYHSARVLLGRTLLEMDRLEESAAEFRAVLEVEPQNLLAGRLLAGIYRSQGHWEQALETFRGLQAFYPDDSEVRTQVYQLERGPGPASGDPSAIGGSGSFASPAEGALATNTLAEIYLRQGLVDRAIAVYENMLRADPDNQAVHHRMAEIVGMDPGNAKPPAAPGLRPAPATRERAVQDPRRKAIRELQTWLIAIQKG